MSTSLLYHYFGIRSYKYVSTHYESEKVIFRILKERTALRCPQCGSARVICKGSIERRFASVPMGSKQVLIVMAVQRVLCLAFHVLRQITIDFADPRRSYTRQFDRYAL